MKRNDDSGKFENGGVPRNMYECPYCGKLIKPDEEKYECGSDGMKWYEHVKCADEADAASC